LKYQDRFVIQSADDDLAGMTRDCWGRQLRHIRKMDRSRFVK